MIKLKEILKEGILSQNDAEKILDALVKIFKGNKHGDSLKYLLTDRTYRRYAIRAIRSTSLGE
jgi:hypothetical protein|tara:strand:+ start:2006 stop:2194 length:189 start_codon:yes stop_codon:yes gene_type:complete